MASKSIKAAHIFSPGQASGLVLKLDEPLSFWGGFDPNDGKILDQNHPQAGQSISNKVLVLPGTRGSAGTPGGVAEAMRRKVGPTAMILLTADVNVTIGIQVANFLYQQNTPVLAINESDFASLQTGMQVAIKGENINVTLS